MTTSDIEATRLILENEVLLAPFESVPKMILADFGEEHCPKEVAPGPLRKNRFPIGQFVRHLIEALKYCNFAPATWDKKFAGSLPLDIPECAKGLSPKQWCWLIVLLYRYRRSQKSTTAHEFVLKWYDRYCAELGIKHRTARMRKIDAAAMRDTPLLDSLE